MSPAFPKLTTNPISIVMHRNKISLFLLFALSCGTFSLQAELSDCGDNLLPANPTSPASYTCAAIASGNWGATNTWNNGVVPTTLANPTVLIPAAYTVTIGNPYTNNAISNMVVYGSLKFINNGQMRLSTLLVRAGGLLQMGTDAAPIASNYLASISIVDDGPVYTNWDITAVSHGILNEGTVTICGSDKTDFVALAGDAAAGVTNLTLASAPSGWQVGDFIVLASTTFSTNWTTSNPVLQNEVRTINTISGTSVTFTNALAYAHTRAQTGLQIHVANLTRNVVIQSEASNIDNRGHFMTCTNSAVIRNALFLRMGRTDKTVVVTDPGIGKDSYNNPRARYSLHFHEVGTDTNLTPGVVTGCVVWDTPGWGFVNHESYVNFTNNVAFDFDGCGFATENGDEAGSFVNNLAIGGDGDGDFPETRILYCNTPRRNAGDTGFNGEGYWFESPDITVTGNIAAGCKGAGYVWWCGGHYLPSTTHFTGFPRNRVPAGVVPRYWNFDTNQVLVEDLPIKKCDNNVAYGCFAGMKLRWVDTGDFLFYQDLPVKDCSVEIVKVGKYLTSATRLPSTISNCTFWNVENGLHAYYAEGITFLNITNICVNTNGSLGGIGVALLQDPAGQNYTNLVVKNFITGLAMDTNDTGTVSLDTNSFTMTGVLQQYYRRGIDAQELGFTNKTQQFQNTH